jgi:hypothetical protein
MHVSYHLMHHNQRVHTTTEPFPSLAARCRAREPPTRHVAGCSMPQSVLPLPPPNHPVVGCTPVGDVLRGPPTPPGVLCVHRRVVGIVGSLIDAINASICGGDGQVLLRAWPWVAGSLQPCHGCVWQAELLCEHTVHLKHALGLPTGHTCCQHASSVPSTCPFSPGSQMAVHTSKYAGLVALRSCPHTRLSFAAHSSLVQCPKCFAAGLPVPHNQLCSPAAMLQCCCVVGHPGFLHGALPLRSFTTTF